MAKKKKFDDVEKVEEPKMVKKDPEFVTKEDLDKKLDSFFERMKGIISVSVSNNKHADNEHKNQGKTFKSGELSSNQPIEKITESDIIEGAVELEAFMNEKILITVHGKSDKGSLPVVTPNVNGVNHPIIRNVDSLVKRKFVEALARCSNTDYVQEVNPLNPENFIMVPNTAVKDPFTVKHDPSGEVGHKWLDNILKEAC